MWGPTPGSFSIFAVEPGCVSGGHSGLIPSVLGFSFSLMRFASLLQEALLCPTLLVITVGKHGQDSFPIFV